VILEFVVCNPRIDVHFGFWNLDLEINVPGVDQELWLRCRVVKIRHFSCMEFPLFWRT
jgi:hypothetical protein